MTDERRAVTTHELLRMKEQGERIVVLTCYDALFARLLDASGVDILLVGDSVNQVLAAAETTLSATLEQMLYHTRLVRRGSERSLVICDMPFLTYQVSKEEAIRNCGRVLAETGCHGVKLEGGRPVVETVRALADVGIPVMGHLGLTPQSVHAIGGYRVQGRDARGANGCWMMPRRSRTPGRSPWCWSSSPRRSPPRSPRRSRSQPSESAQVPRATARCSCYTTCSVSMKASIPSS